MRNMLLRVSAFFSSVFLLYLISCSGSDEPKPVDCTLSDLGLTANGQNPTSCSANDGTITAIAVGGDQPYKFAINTGSFSATSIFTSLSGGDYIIRVKDKNGCETSTDVLLEIPGENPLTATTISLEDTECVGNNGSIEILASGGVPPYLYRIGTSAFVDVSIFNNLAPGNYSVAVKDAAECIFTKGALVAKGLTSTSLADDVEPIIDLECAISGCHNGTQSPDLRSSASIISHASQIKSVTQSGAMPRNGSLTSSQKALIACWVDDGAKNN